MGREKQEYVKFDIFCGTERKYLERTFIMMVKNC